MSRISMIKLLAFFTWAPEVVGVSSGERKPLMRAQHHDALDDDSLAIDSEEMQIDRKGHASRHAHASKDRKSAAAVHAANHLGDESHGILEERGDKANISDPNSEDTLDQDKEDPLPLDPDTVDDSSLGEEEASELTEHQMHEFSQDEGDSEDVDEGNALEIYDSKSLEEANLSSNSTAGGNVPLKWGWRSYGGGYGTATFAVKNGVCIVEGLIKGSRWGYMAQLPGHCRPNKRLIFNQNNHQYTTRIDVLTNGQVHYCGGHKSHGWVSLSGIAFAARTLQMSPLQLHHTHAYGGSYGTPTYVLSKGFCVIEGLLNIRRRRGWGHLATIHTDCRPKTRLIFNLNNHQYSARVDVSTNGAISWHAGGRSHNWLSLSGIFFDVSRDSKTTVPLVRGWKSYRSSYGEVTFTSKEGFCEVEGLALMGGRRRFGHMATLPAICRPNKVLLFNQNNHQYSTRIDVHKNGQIHWAAGGHSHNWISLSGIKFAVSDIVGKNGKSGSNGRNGAKGSTGAKGATGARGAAGPPGPLGKNAANGAKGAKGDAGANGNIGPPGARGLQGPKADPIDCKWAEWDSWTECTKSCAGGTRTKVRSFSVYPQDGGKQCSGKDKTIEACKKEDCPTTTTTTTTTTTVVEVKASAYRSCHVMGIALAAMLAFSPAVV